MSLIQDALKRKREEEQRMKPNKQPTPSRGKPAPRTAGPKQKRPSSAKKILAPLVIVILLILLATGAFLLPQFHPRALEVDKSAPAAPAQVSEGKAAEAAIATGEKPAPLIPEISFKRTAAKWPRLSLTGFAAGGSERLVIINGEMLSTGNRIDGVLIQAIGKNEVTLEYQGEERILRVDSK